MYNWSTDTSLLKKDKKKYTLWKLEQLVNFGLDGERLSASELRSHWSRLQLDPAKKAFLKILLYADSH